MRHPRSPYASHSFRRRLARTRARRSRWESPSTSLHCLVALNDAKALQAVLSSGANPHQVDATGCTPLHVALMLDRIDCLQTLLSHGAHPGAVVAEPNSDPTSWLRCVSSFESSSPWHFAVGDLAGVLVRSDVALECLMDASSHPFPLQSLWEGLMHHPDDMSRRLPLLVSLHEKGVEMRGSLDVLVSHHKRWMHLGYEEALLSQVRQLLQWGVIPTAQTLALAVAPLGQDALDVAERSLDLFKMLLQQESVDLWPTASDALPSAESLLRHRLLPPGSTHLWLEAYQHSREHRLSQAWPMLPHAPANERL